MSPPTVYVLRAIAGGPDEPGTLVVYLYASVGDPATFPLPRRIGWAVLSPAIYALIVQLAPEVVRALPGAELRFVGVLPDPAPVSDSVLKGFRLAVALLRRVTAREA